MSKEVDFLAYNIKWYIKEVGLHVHPPILMLPIVQELQMLKAMLRRFFLFLDGQITLNPLTAKLSKGNKLRDFYNSVTNSVGIGFDTKKGFNLFA